MHPLIVVGAVVFSSIVFSLGGFINALLAKNFDQVNWIPTFVLTPLTYFAGTFYSIRILPHFAQTLSYANPIMYMVNAFRYGLLGVSDVNVSAAFAITIGLAVALFTTAVMMMNSGRGIRD
jgi:ABC-2 type transport system permease protein